MSAFENPQDPPPALLARLLDSKNQRLPMNNVWAELATAWCKRNSASNRQLAEHLGIREQSCSQWKFGTDDRQPTWPAVVQLLDELNMQVVIDADGVTVKRRRSKRKK